MQLREFFDDGKKLVLKQTIGRLIVYCSLCEGNRDTWPLGNLSPTKRRTIFQECENENNTSERIWHVVSQTKSYKTVPTFPCVNHIEIPHSNSEISVLCLRFISSSYRGNCLPRRLTFFVTSIAVSLSNWNQKVELDLWSIVEHWKRVFETGLLLFFFGPFVSSCKSFKFCRKATFSFRIWPADMHEVTIVPLLQG